MNKKYYPLFSSIVLSVFFMTFTILQAGQVGTLGSTLKKGEIGEKSLQSEQKAPSAKTKTTQTQAPKKNEISFEAPVNMVQYKQTKIKINGKDRIVRIPFINPAFAKKNPPDKRPARITEKPAPRRIGSPKKGTKIKSGKYYEVPCSYEVLGYPLDESDKFRLSGEDKIYELYSLVAALTPANYGDNITAIHMLKYEIMEKYGKYSDICAAAQLYCNDAFEKYSKDVGFFKYQYSTSSCYFQYSQLGIQYQHLKDSNGSMKAILDVIDDRKKEMKENDKALIEKNKEYENEIKKYYIEIEKAKNAMYSSKPDEQTMNNFAADIANKYSYICYNYGWMYENLMQANEKEKAAAIFNVVKSDDGYALTGKLYDAYLEVPYELPLKYSYSACAPPNHPTKLPATRDCQYGEITISGEVKVKMYRDADILLQIVKGNRSSQTLDKEDAIESDGRSRNEKRTLDLCDYLSTFKPSPGDEDKNIAPEKISPEQLEKYKANAYSLIDNSPEYNDFYKRKPYIKELYFSSNENTKLPETSISLPEEYSTIRASIDFEKPYTPSYAFTCKVYTVKPPQLPEVPVPAVTKTESEIDRQKFVTLVPDSLFYGYYAKFKINETDSDSETPQPPIPPPVPDSPPTGPVISLNTKSKLKVKKTRTDEVTHKTVVQNGKDAEKESISILSGYKGYEDGLPLYNNKTFFKKQLARSSWKGQDATNNVLENTKEFCIMGGAEITWGEKNGKKTFEVVKNQADWLMIESLGNERADINKGFLKLVNSKAEYIYVLPSELEGKYNEDVDILILDACFCMNSFNKLKWKKVLPEGLIIGFTGEIKYPGQTEYSFKLFNDKLKPNMTSQDISDAFLDTNAGIINDNAINDDEQRLETDSAYHQAACIIGTMFGEVVQTCKVSSLGIKTYKYEKRYKPLQ